MRAVRSISAVLLAFLVLVSSTNFAVGMHFCMGEVESIALFGKAEGCAKEKALPACHRHVKPACCEDQTVYHEAADFKAPIQQSDSFALFAFELFPPLVPVSEIIPCPAVVATPSYYYDPPLPQSNLTVVHRAFRI